MTVLVYKNSEVLTPHRSSDTPLPSLKSLLPRTKNKKTHIPLEGEEMGSMGMCTRGSFRVITVISNSDPK